MCPRQQRLACNTLAFCVLVLFSIYLIAPDFLAVKRLFELKTTVAPTLSQQLKKLLQCQDHKLQFEKKQYGDYYLLQNLFIGSKSKSMKCAKTITYTTNTDYLYLNSLPILLESWMAPVSIAVYAPGLDFYQTMKSIQYLRNCINESKLVRDFATFHIYFPNNHMPPRVPLNEIEALSWKYNCKAPPPFMKHRRSKTYRAQAKLTFPINVGRNIARKSVNTYFILSSDIELIPSPGLVPLFMSMIANNKSILQGNNGLRVFHLPVFEVYPNVMIPKTKTQLSSMLEKSMSIPFHIMVCEYCHAWPNQTLWLNAPDEDRLSIVAVSKRHGRFRSWEPFFISNNKEPFFDELFTWEGQSDKRIQNFAMCLLDYEYLTLHPAFLTHMPGIKYYKKSRMRYVPAMNKIIKTEILPQYKIFYGHNMECYM